MTKVTLNMPGFEFEGIRQRGRIYISASDIIGHLEETAKVADPVNEDAAAIMRAYRGALVEAVAKLV